MAGILYCPECREEYVSSATRCVECGVLLVSEASLRSAAPAVEELPPVSQLVCLRAATLAFVQGLSAQLAQAGISHRIEASQEEGEEVTLRRPGQNLPYGIYVRQADLPAALDVDREYMRLVIPDLAHTDEPAGDEACPACGTPLAPDAVECSDCGLTLSSDA